MNALGIALYPRATAVLLNAALRVLGPRYSTSVQLCSANASSVGGAVAVPLCTVNSCNRAGCTGIASPQHSSLRILTAEGAAPISAAQGVTAGELLVSVVTPLDDPGESASRQPR